MTNLNIDNKKRTKTIYDCFDDILESIFIKKTSYFNHELTIDENDISRLFDAYIVGGLDNGKYEEEYNKLIKGTPEKKKVDNEKTTFLRKSRLQIDVLYPKNNVKSENLKHVFAAILWLRYMSISDITEETKTSTIERWIEKNDKKFPEPIASFGMAQLQVDQDVSHLICLFKYLYITPIESADNTIDVIKNRIVNWILDKPEEGAAKGVRTNFINLANQKERLKNNPPFYNILLHLCDREKYEPMASSRHKNNIVSKLGKLCISNDTIAEEYQYTFKEWDKKSIDEQVFCIRKRIDLIIQNDHSSQSSFKFYNNYLKILWSDFGDDKGMSPLSALSYKKAIVLYGPPGTSKTYSTQRLAELLLLDIDQKEGIENYLKTNAAAIKNIANDSSTMANILGEEAQKRIYPIQLHPNYTYEDFIWGYQIEGNRTVARKGAFLKLLDIIKNDPQQKYVLILDEINRVDLSRLFGEVFSCIENRDQELKLSVKLEGDDSPSDVSSIMIPSNLYIIGTMNEIDFSLERVDFALRRRFVWFFHGFNVDTLSDMLGENSEEYLSACKELNAQIEKHPDLGRQYQIGHTFFAEINEIQQKSNAKECREILWNISIRPMLEAYLGNMKQDERDAQLNDLAAIFLKNSTKKKADNALESKADEEEDQ